MNIADTNIPAWEGFTGGQWQKDIDTAVFVRLNYTPYEDGPEFLADATPATETLWNRLQALQKEERAKGGVLDMDTDVVSSITSHAPGYLDKDLEKVVGLQTDKPLKRAFMPYGGIKMAEEALKTYGYTPNPDLHRIFTEYHKTHNQGVFDAYTPEMRIARKNKIITGLPDTYGRGRIVGDYRRVALYGVDALMEFKKADKRKIAEGHDVIMDGRDIGTKVLPNATLKIYLTASVEERARRRCLELAQKGNPEPYEKVLEDMKARDYQDTHRAASPLRPADDAVTVDTTNNTLEESVAEIRRLALEAIDRR